MQLVWIENCTENCVFYRNILVHPVSVKDPQIRKSNNFNLHLDNTNFQFYERKDKFLQSLFMLMPLLFAQLKRTDLKASTGLRIALVTGQNLELGHMFLRDAMGAGICLRTLFSLGLAYSRYD